MYTYSVQQHRTSGEVYVIRWDGERIHGVCGPLTSEQVFLAVYDVEDAPAFDYEAPGAMGAAPQDWLPPLACHDPASGETWRDEAWLDA